VLIFAIIAGVLLVLIAAQLFRARYRSGSGDDRPDQTEPTILESLDVKPEGLNDGLTTLEPSAHDRAQPPGAEDLTEPGGGAPEQEPAPISVADEGGADQRIDRAQVAQSLGEDGERQQAAGAYDAAGELFLQSLVVATEIGQPRLIALARLRLGDLAEQTGDLTSACEHWQMARELFSKTEQALEAEQVADRMQRTQCPTDWVLTDF